MRRPSRSPARPFTPPGIHLSGMTPPPLLPPPRIHPPGLAWELIDARGYLFRIGQRVLRRNRARTLTQLIVTETGVCARTGGTESVPKGRPHPLSEYVPLELAPPPDRTPAGAAADTIVQVLADAAVLHERLRAVVDLLHADRIDHTALHIARLGVLHRADQLGRRLGNWLADDRRVSPGLPKAARLPPGTVKRPRTGTPGA